MQARATVTFFQSFFLRAAAPAAGRAAEEPLAGFASDALGGGSLSSAINSLVRYSFFDRLGGVRPRRMSLLFSGRGRGLCRCRWLLGARRTDCLTTASPRSRVGF